MKDHRKKFCFTLDLKDDKEAIESYRLYHKNVWPEILEQIKSTGVEVLEIYLVSNRLFMIMETSAEFTLKAKQQKDATDPKVQEWEALMSNYQQALPFAKIGEKWVLMEQIFSL
ncbi:L-rhamnose mutarotase [Flavobacteriaceae bacterium]|nr:L-rhamnose mutarotase [Flavobacteriaceae bacterium]